jgi:hypothetical protein
MIKYPVLGGYICNSKWRIELDAILFLTDIVVDNFLENRWNRGFSRGSLEDGA